MTSTSIENEHIQVSVDRQPECKVILAITTLPLASKAAKSSAIKTVAKQVNIPGFRKGRAPDALVEERFAPQIDREFRDILVRNAINEAIRITKIMPTRNNEAMKMLKFEPLEEGTYFISVEFESFPEVPTVDLNSISIEESAPKPVGEQEIENRIEDLRLRHATWEEVTDRPAQDKDYVTLDIESMEGQPFYLHNDTKFHLADKKMPLWARSLVTGLNIGEAKEGHSELDEGENASTFKSRLCRITLKKIELPKLPALDDALAQKAGVPTVQGLRDAIHKSLEKNALSVAQNEMRKAARAKLLELYPFDIPGQQIQKLRQDCEQIAENARSHFPTEEEWNFYKNNLFEDGKQTVRLSYLLPKTLRDHGLPLPTGDQIQQRATEQMMIRYMQGDKNLTEADLKYFTQVAESELITESALDFIIANGKKG